MATKVVKLGIKKEVGYLYYLDKKGNVSRAKMGRGKMKGGKPEVVSKIGHKREAGFLYFIDKAGDLAKAKLARGRRKKRK